MQRGLILCLFFICVHFAWAQKQFIRTNNNANFGQGVRIVSVKDNGWIVFASDSLKMIRFDRCSQVKFNNQYLLPNVTNAKADIVALGNNGCAVLTTTSSNGRMSPVVTEIDSSGNIIWCKSLESLSAYEMSCSISADSAGFIYVVSRTIFSDSTSGNAVIKMDYQGNIVWDKIFDKSNSSSDVIITSDNGILLRCGNCFIKTDDSFHVRWSTTIANPIDYFTRPVETGNGYLFTCNVSLSGDISLMKLGINGNLVIRKRTDFTGVANHLTMKKDRNICGYFLRTFNGVNYPTLLNLDSNLNIVSQKSISFYNFYTSLTVLDVSILNSDLPVFAGVTMPTGSLFYGRSDENYNLGCDTVLSPVQISAEPSVQASAPSAIADFSHTINDLTATKISLIDSQIVLCSVPIEITIGGDSLICGSRPATLKNIASDFFDSFLWSQGDTSEQVVVDEPGSYWLMGIGECGMDTMRDTIQIVERELIPADLGKDKYKCETNTLTLKAPDCDHCSYLWSDGSVSKTMDVKSYGNQWLKVTNDGCVSVDTVNIITAKCECQFFLPNTITPNHDGINDVLKPKYYCDMTDYSLKIINRWGELIFETDDVEQAWDARYHNIPVEEGVYIYVVTYTTLMEGVDGDKVQKTGSLGVIY